MVFLQYSSLGHRVSFEIRVWCHGSCSLSTTSAAAERRTRSIYFSEILGRSSSVSRGICKYSTAAFVEDPNYSIIDQHITKILCDKVVSSLSYHIYLAWALEVSGTFNFDCYYNLRLKKWKNSGKVTALLVSPRLHK